MKHDKIRLAEIPSDPQNDGEITYNSASAKFRKKENGVVSDLNSGGTQNVYIQQTEPTATPPFIWFQTNALGKVIDIRQSI